MNFVQLFALVLGLVLAGMVPDSDAPLGLDHLTVFLSILPPVSSFGPGFFERIGNVLFFGVGGGALAFLLLLIVDVHQSQPRALTPVWFVVACLASLLDTVLSPICGMRPFLELSALLFDNGPGVAAIKEMLVKSRETLRSQADTIRGLNATIARLNGRFYDITQVYHVETRSLRKGTIQPAVEGTYPWRVPSVFHRLYNRTDLYLVFLKSKLDKLQSVVADNTSIMAQLECRVCEALRTESELEEQIERLCEQRRRDELDRQQREPERMVIRRLNRQLLSYPNSSRPRWSMPPRVMPHRVKPIGQAPAVSSIDFATLRQNVDQFEAGVYAPHDSGFVTGPVAFPVAIPVAIPVPSLSPDLGQIDVGPSANSVVGPQPMPSSSFVLLPQQGDLRPTPAATQGMVDSLPTMVEVPEERPDVEMIDIDDLVEGPSAPTFDFNFASTSTTADRGRQTAEFSSGTDDAMSDSPANVSPLDVLATVAAAAAARPAAQVTAPGTVDDIDGVFNDPEFERLSRVIGQSLETLRQEDSAQGGQQGNQRAATSTAPSLAPQVGHSTSQTSQTAKLRKRCASEEADDLRLRSQ